MRVEALFCFPPLYIPASSIVEEAVSKRLNRQLIEQQIVNLI